MLRDQLKGMIPNINIKDVQTPGGAAASAKELAEARENIIQIAKCIDAEATKFTVGALVASKEDQCSALCKDLKDASEKYARAVVGISQFTRTLALRKLVLQEGARLLASVHGLAEHAILTTQKGGAKLSAPKAGLVFECCKRQKTLPKSDKIAVKREIMAATLQIKDTADEFAASLEGVDEDVFVGDDMFADEAMSEEEKNVTTAAVLVMRRCQRLCKSCAKVMAAVSLSPNAKVAASLDKLAKHSREIAAQITELGCALYAPIEDDACAEMNSSVLSIGRDAEVLQSALLTLPHLQSSEQKVAVKNICDGLMDAIASLRKEKLLQNTASVPSQEMATSVSTKSSDASE